MKKAFVIFLMLMYGFSSSGMTVTLHYCCGKLDDISLSGTRAIDCAMGNRLKKTSCCTSAEIGANVNAHQQTVVQYAPTQSSNVVPVTHQFSPLFICQLVVVNRLARGAPNPSLSVPIFIKNCVYRI